jgi:hypothetical protein
VIVIDHHPELSEYVDNTINLWLLKHPWN